MTKNVFFHFQRIKSELEDKTRTVQQTLDIITEISATGSDVITIPELNQLQSDGRRLKDRFDFVSSTSGKLQKSITTSYDDLKKFASEVSSFSKWIEKAFQVSTNLRDFLPHASHLYLHSLHSWC